MSYSSTLGTDWIVEKPIVMLNDISHANNIAKIHKNIDLPT